MDCLLVLFLSCDALLAAGALGARGVRITPSARLVLSGCGTLCLGLSFFISRTLSSLLPEGLLQMIGCVALLFIALGCLFEEGFRRLSERLSRKCLTFHLKGLCFVLHITAEPADADADRSGTLSAKEAVLLALPLSLDSLVSGLTVTSSAAFRLLLLLFSLGCGLTAVILGERLGRRLGQAAGAHASLLSGLGLLMIALTKAF